MKYIMRLDDACERRNVENWDRIEKLLDAYGIKPLVGIIPHCEDPMMEDYAFDNDFWGQASLWKKKWTIALHGYNHILKESHGGLNPVNGYSEFVGEALEVQKQKIKDGVEIMRKHNIDPLVFFAPAHTFDEFTIEALKSESNIRIISDTVANCPYSKDGITYVPQQCGSVRVLPFKTVTFCYHPNTMCEEEFIRLDNFLKKYRKKFIDFPEHAVCRSKSFVDIILEKLYFVRRK